MELAITNLLFNRKAKNRKLDAVKQQNLTHAKVNCTTNIRDLTRRQVHERFRSPGIFRRKSDGYLSIGR